MRRWTCINCGNVEQLNIYPDACSSCGSAMICDDGRTTHGRNEPRVTDDFDLLNAAAEGDAEANVILWQELAPKSTYDTDMIADLLLQNRIAMMQSVYGAAA